MICDIDQLLKKTLNATAIPRHAKTFKETAKTINNARKLTERKLKERLIHYSGILQIHFLKHFLYKDHLNSKTSNSIINLRAIKNKRLSN